MKIEHITVSICATNCYLLYEEDTKKMLIIDPGDRPDRIEAKIQAIGGKPCAIWLTHGHFDHIGAAEALRKKYGIEIWASETEKDALEDPGINLSGMFPGDNISVKADHYFKDGDCLSFGDHKAKVIATPGHTKGGVCFFFEEEKILFSGDTLFCESYGRSDFPGGNERELLSSIVNKLFLLPDDVVVYPGHNEETQIGYEKKHNPASFYCGRL